MQKVLVDFIQKYKERVDLGIAEELEKRLAEVREISPHLVPVLAAMRELSVGGKRLRAMLTILGYEMSGQEVNDEIIKAAVVMEIFHLGLLIQDDFMDRDMKRRGVATLIARYDDKHVGNFVSMLAGDYTFGWGIEIITNLKFSNSQIVGAMKVWGKYFTRVGYGQTLDGLAIADDATILKILAIKSGEYTCVLPLLLGATLGGASSQVLSDLESYAMELGWVFQLRDDWLAEFGETTKTGKPVGNDSREGKRTYVTMYGKEKTETATYDHLIKGRSLAMGNKVLEALVEWMGTRDN
jgi:geranylgeranyl diphosphate synthase type I